MQYVLGHWAFRKLDLMVDRRVLIPRPETEVVVEVALCRSWPVSRWASPVVVDLGTGSGAIALSIASERRRRHGLGHGYLRETRSPWRPPTWPGLGVQAVGRVQLVQGSWWDALPGRLKGSVTLAVANPPYVAEGELADLPDEVSAVGAGPGPGGRPERARGARG